jgi:hypothetical protein
LLEKKENIRIDLLICCGDFQAIRNEYDLSCISVPPKYRDMGTFYTFFAGVERAPYPTIRVNGLRIAGLSGIYKPQDYQKGNYLSLPCLT